MILIIIIKISTVFYNITYLSIRSGEFPKMILVQS